MQRYGSVIRLNDEKLQVYEDLHAAVRPRVQAMITECNVQNYSIYMHDLDGSGHFLFSYFEYVGTDFEADMAKMAADPTTQEWWTLCEPCQQPLNNRKEGEWWATMREVYHQY